MSTEMQVIPVVSAIPIIAQINDTMSTGTTTEVNTELFLEMVDKVRRVGILEGELKYLKSKIKAEHQETRASIEEEHKKTRAHIVTTNKIIENKLDETRAIIENKLDETRAIIDNKLDETREEVKEAVAEVNGTIDNKLDNLWDNHLSRINDMEENLTIVIKKMRGYFHTAIDDRLKKWKRAFMSL